MQTSAPSQPVVFLKRQDHAFDIAQIHTLALRMPKARAHQHRPWSRKLVVSLRTLTLRSRRDTDAFVYWMDAQFSGAQVPLR